MRIALPITACLLGYCLVGQADVWTWLDAEGKTHYVDSNTPIWTWTDTSGLVHYSDKPETEDAIRVALIWYSDGGLPEQQQSTGTETAVQNDELSLDETDEERLEREAAEAYYCKQARKIYDTYLNAPQLYRTNEDGSREYLTPEETAAKLEETEIRVAELCD